MPIRKEHYDIFLEGSQMYNLVINEYFIDYLRLFGGGDMRLSEKRFKLAIF